MSDQNQKANDVLSLNQRMAENEVMFRQYNESVEARIEKLKQAAAHDEIDHGIDEEVVSFHFYCECSDDSCHERIELNLLTYKAIHEDRACFVVIPGHQVEGVEMTVDKKESYVVVKKYEAPPKAATKLHTVPLNNT